MLSNFIRENLFKLNSAIIYLLSKIDKYVENEIRI